MSPPFFVDDVADDERRQEQEAVARHGRLRGNVDLVDGDDLALQRSRLPHHLHTRQDFLFFISGIFHVFFA